MPVGSNMPKTVDVRIIAATNRDLETLVAQGTMREDFFFRLSIISITIPSLRERKEDLPFLIDYFLAQHRKGANRTMLPGKVLQALYRHEWPGNIRELQNVLQRYLTLNRLEFPGSRHAKLLAVQEAGSEANLIVQPQNLQKALDTFEKTFLTKVLEQHHWHKTQTAQALGIGRKTLYRKMKQFGLL